MPYIKINYKVLNYDSIIYVDANNGDDTNGDGSENNPYLTLSTSINNASPSNKNAIMLLSDIETTNFSDLLKHSKRIDFIGNNHNIKIESDEKSRSYDGGSEKVGIYNIKFIESDNYQTIIDEGFFVPEGSNFVNNFELYNCVFDFPNYQIDWSNNRAFFGHHNPSTKIFNFYNCDFNFPNINHGVFHTSDTIVKNCSTTNNFGNATVTTSLTSATYDSDYNITTSGWENQGTGENPDGSQAHIGVYGGLYAWNWTLRKILTLFKQTSDNQLITFDGLNWEQLGETLDLNLFETKGMDEEEVSEEDLYEENNKEMTHVEDTANGKIFNTDISLSHDRFKKLISRNSGEIDLSGGTGGQGGEYVYTAPNGVTVESSMATYSSDSKYHLSYLFDGTITQSNSQQTTYWLTETTNDNQSLIFDFSNSTIDFINNIKIYPRSRDDASSDYRILISDDNSNWTESVSWVNNTSDSSTPYGTVKEHVIDTNSDYIKFELTSNGSFGVTLSEIEFIKNDSSKYLMLSSDGYYKTFNQGLNKWENITSETPTEDEFKTYGLNSVTRKDVKKIGENIVSIYTWDNYTSGTSRNLKFNAYSNNYSLTLLDRALDDVYIYGTEDENYTNGKTYRYQLSDLNNIKAISNLSFE